MTLEINHLSDPISKFFATVPYFSTIGFWLVLALAVIPFMPFPPETLAGVMVLGEDNPDEKTLLAWKLGLLIGFGSFISHIIVYTLSRMHLHKLTNKIGGKKPNILSNSHWFHKYLIYIMVGIPTLSIFIPPLIDAVMVPLGHYRVNRVKLFTLVFAGEMIRGSLTSLILLGLLNL